MVEIKESYKGIELYFDDIPDDSTRNLLKGMGWRWNQSKGCWYNFKSEENKEFAKSLCEHLTPKAPSPILSWPRLPIYVEEILVRRNNLICDEYHETEDIAGEVSVISRDGKLLSYLIPVLYCKTCDVFYVLESTYLNLKKKGIILCQVMTYKTYKKYGLHGALTSGGIESWSDESPLKIWGYNVSSTEDLTEAQRRGALASILDCKVMNKDRMISYLNTFIKTHPNATNAISKWESDREFVEHYKIGENKIIKFGSLTVIT